MRLGLLICAFEMARELPRTIHTFSRQYQRDVDGLDFEIVVVDNGSNSADEAALRAIAPNLRVVHAEQPSSSPAAAINTVARTMDCSVIGICIDGARMASPGLLARAIEAHERDPSKVIGTLSFHLGPDLQMRSRLTGYDQVVEDRLLDRTPWREDGYNLFGISTLAGSSAEGWFGPIRESNAVFMSKSLWNQIGGIDERFVEPGGGFCNLEFWERAVAASDHAPWIILGEGTFHQVHGGAATSGTDETRVRMLAEYERLAARPFAPLPYRPCYVGQLDQSRFSAGMPLGQTGRRVHSVADRPFNVGIEPKLLETIQNGTLASKYKGVRFCKNPFDIALYMKLIQALRPQTIIEIGTSEGGSSLWFNDQCAALGLDETRIIGIDLVDPGVSFDKFQFFIGDSTRPWDTFPTEVIKNAPKPWLVVEDSAHSYESVAAVLKYFHEFLATGDYLVVEDGVVADLQGPQYTAYEDGPNRAVAEFLLAHPSSFAIDDTLCDMFGRNVTYCPNAWLRRI